MNTATTETMLKTQMRPYTLQNAIIMKEQGLVNAKKSDVCDNYNTVICLWKNATNQAMRTNLKKKRSAIKLC
jgi:hypothetical protein